MQPACSSGSGAERLIPCGRLYNPRTRINHVLAAVCRQFEMTPEPKHIWPVAWRTRASQALRVDGHWLRASDG